VTAHPNRSIAESGVHYPCVQCYFCPWFRAFGDSSARGRRREF
jgi:hypothetical protein